ncbi:protein containing PAS domain [Sulfurimonas gotlandica GD1]|jgi:PAS domain S-box-containing protein|uniref:Protein containing PAS domain n=1 Tax=Sulfurimonas gotlandica (strain DSM 19862 / JCM 16533 / GD1) TaxID=929558 RepID=B6BM87_SULGG|nr:PAS domain S-box protein [Sulfurimonas gotlandica]EDZ61839.1 methyl-accepting chemotaxis sensory transducer with Pas/Pac sensor [Sulfurimonas gotlandica GD1]EHP29335.1 protein containing PAS domain [Sulfurimonas gotlandica GD1]
MDKVVPMDEEYIFEGSMIISQTDLKGNITFANRKFCEVSGYKVDELIGSNHNIIRHPDMPKAAFAKMWSTIQGGQAWNGLVKNLRKDGLYYWVDSEIIPVRNDNEEIIGYIAARKVASRKDIEENKELYRKMLETEN